MNIGERLRYYRKRHRWMLWEVAERTGLSVSYLSDMERGRVLPSLESCQKLADAYGVTLTLLFAGVEIR